MHTAQSGRCGTYTGNRPRLDRARRCLVLSCAPALLVLSAASAQAQDIVVRVDPRIELFSAIARVAGYPEYAVSPLESYAASIDSALAGFADHPAIHFARRMRSERGIAYDAVISLAIHVTDPPALLERRPFEDAGIALDPRWRPEEARVFLTHIRDLVRAAALDTLFASHADLQRAAERRLAALVDDGVDFDWVNRFFGTRAGATFHLTAGLLNGSQNYGPRYESADGTLEFHSVLAVEKTDSAGMPVFEPQATTRLVVHELGHSFVNPLLERDSAALRPAGRAIFRVVGERMTEQAYGRWKSVLNESLVRAVELRYARAHGSDAAALERQTRWEQHRGFVWIEALDSLLGEYEAGRDRYGALDTFTPRLREFYSDIGGRIDSLAAAYEARRPRLASSSVADGSAVVPGVVDLLLVFDRDMHEYYGFDFVQPDGRVAFPQFTDLCWLDKRRFFARMRLDPGRAYGFTTNRSFRSDDWISLAPVVLRFQTTEAGDEREPPPAPCPQR